MRKLIDLGLDMDMQYEVEAIWMDEITHELSREIHGVVREEWGWIIIELVHVIAKPMSESVFTHQVSHDQVCWAQT